MAHPPFKLVDQADIDNKIANVASKQMRGRILALMPKHMIAAGVAAAKRTLAGGGEKPISERLIAMAGAFGKFGVTNDMLVTHLGHPVDNTTIDELADLMGIYSAIREGAKASDYFGAIEKQEANASTAAVIAAQAKQSPAAATPQAPEQAQTLSTAKPARRNAQQLDSNAQKESTAETQQEKAQAEQPKPTEPVPSNPAQGSDDDVF